MKNMIKKILILILTFLSLHAMEESETSKKGCFQALKYVLHCKHNLCCPTIKTLCPALVRALETGDLKKVREHATTSNVNCFGETAKGLQSALEIVLASKNAYEHLLPIIDILKSKGFQTKLYMSPYLFSMPLKALEKIAHYEPQLILPSEISEDVLFENAFTQSFISSQEERDHITDTLSKLAILEILPNLEKVNTAQEIIGYESVQEAIKKCDLDLFKKLMHYFPIKALKCALPLTLPQYLQELRDDEAIDAAKYHSFYGYLHEYCMTHETTLSTILAQQLNEIKMEDCDFDETHDRIIKWRSKTSDDPINDPSPVDDIYYDYDDDETSPSLMNKVVLPGTAENHHV